MLKNKALAIILPIIAIGILFYVYTTQFAGKEMVFDLKAQDGTVIEKVVLSEGTKFPIEYKGKKECMPAMKYLDTKTNKVVFLRSDEPIPTHYTLVQETAKK